MLTYFVLLALSFETQIGAYPDTLLFIRINLAPSLIAAAAGSIALIFGTLRYRAQVTDIEQGAVPAVFAAVQKGFDPSLKSVECPV